MRRGEDRNPEHTQAGSRSDARWASMIAQRSLRARSLLLGSRSPQRTPALPLGRPASWRTNSTSKAAAEPYVQQSMELLPHVQQLIAKIHANQTKAVIYVTGGAVQASSWLLSVPGASNTVLETSVPYARDSLVDILGHEPDQFCSERTAIDMAVAAYRRASLLTGFGSQFLGIGATCSLATVPHKRGDHRAFIACHDGERGTWLARLTLAKGARTRGGEDELVSMALLQMLAQASGVDSSGFHLPLLQPPADRGLDNSAHQGSTSTSYSQSPVTSDHDVTVSGQMSDLYEGSHIPMGDPLEALLEGRVRCVEYAGGRVVVDAPRRGKIYLPGSFNPLHKGHIALLKAAVALTGNKQEAAFELSVGNPDKGMLPLTDVQRRVQQFIQADLPAVVTSCPLFTNKADVFASSSFVIGYDTAVRIVLPKYYGESEINMLMDFNRLRIRGCKFLVAGRKDASTGRFCTLEDVKVPSALADLFTGISEDSFRVDLSSTELRERGMSPV